MPEKVVLRMGNPFLGQIARPVERFDTPELRDLVTDLFDTMTARSGAGLSAPQIGIGLRVVVFEVDWNPRYPEAEPVPRTVLINPDIEPVDDAMEDGWEGCLSIPGLRGVVPRYTHIRYSGHGVDGDRLERVVEGFHARVVQHECDHLDGILYPQRMTDLTTLGFEDELSLAGGYEPCSPEA